MKNASVTSNKACYYFVLLLCEHCVPLKAILWACYESVLFIFYIFYMSFRHLAQHVHCSPDSSQGTMELLLQPSTWINMFFYIQDANLLREETNSSYRCCLAVLSLILYILHLTWVVFFIL